jgi:hypothetical protein
MTSHRRRPNGRSGPAERLHAGHHPGDLRLGQVLGLDVALTVARHRLAPVDNLPSVAPVSNKAKAALKLVETITLRPDQLSPSDIQDVQRQRQRCCDHRLRVLPAG